MLGGGPRPTEPMAARVGAITPGIALASPDEWSRVAIPSGDGVSDLLFEHFDVVDVMAFQCPSDKLSRAFFLLVLRIGNGHPVFGPLPVGFESFEGAAHAFVGDQARDGSLFEAHLGG